MSRISLHKRAHLSGAVRSVTLAASMSLAACSHPGTAQGPATETPRSCVEIPRLTDLALPLFPVNEVALPRTDEAPKLAVLEQSRRDTAVDFSPNMFEPWSAQIEPYDEGSDRSMNKAAERGSAPTDGARQGYSRAALEALDRVSALVPVLEDDRGKFLRIASDDIFDAGSARLTPVYTYVLDRLVPVLRKQAGIRIVVQAYTDSLGSAEEARDLSLRRARAVARYLRQRGVPADELAAQGFGPERPIADNSTPEGRRQNRRVEIVLAPQQSHATSNEPQS